MSNTYGYIRVSTIAQRDDRQWLAMREFGIPKNCISADRQSGRDSREQISFGISPVKKKNLKNI